MSSPVVGFAGLTHLGLNSAAAAAARGFRTIGFDADSALIERLRRGEPHVEEPQLADLMREHEDKLTFVSEADGLAECDLVYVAVDVPTDDYGASDLRPVEEIISRTKSALRDDALLVVLCQVPPGFTRSIDFPTDRLFYQVETLIFGRAVERALYPERFIVGCALPGRPLPQAFSDFLGAFECPILPMSFESAELAKISINMCLVASVSVANTLAEVCEQVGADWLQIVPALKLDKRIGQYSYLSPGLGIAGGNLERDLTTIVRLAARHGTDAGVVEAFIANSRHRRGWAFRTLEELVLRGSPSARIAVLGLTYKEDTHSLKNSPSLALISELGGRTVTAYDPLAASDATGPGVKRARSALDAIQDSDVLVVMTPWPEFRSISADEITARMRGRTVLDPYAVLSGGALREAGFTYATLGAGVEAAPAVALK